ncbi:hypothetical protein [Luteolibacter sp. Populi]|uniref:hypothetical protein n=1 Tax=Luteolibacter sp. Populi TaxID=3230487 RepID=UPI003464FFAA
MSTDHYIIHPDSRISANKLGEFMVTNESRKLTILKESKKGKKAVILHYKKARAGFSGSFSPSGFLPEELINRSRAIEASRARNDWERDDNRMSAEALLKVAATAEEMQFSGAQRIRRPQEGWGGLALNGVRVSVQPDVVFSLTHRGRTKVGCAILYTTQEKAKGLDRKLGDHTAGDYVAALLLKLLETRLSHIGIPYPAKCFVMDVHRSHVYTAPARFKTLIHHIEDACKGIASRWDSIEV